MLDSDRPLSELLDHIVAQAQQLLEGDGGVLFRHDARPRSPDAGGRGRRLTRRRRGHVAADRQGSGRAGRQGAPAGCDDRSQGLVEQRRRPDGCARRLDAGLRGLPRRAPRRRSRSSSARWPSTIASRRSSTTRTSASRSRSAIRRPWRSRTPGCASRSSAARWPRSARGWLATCTTRSPSRCLPPDSRRRRCAALGTGRRLRRGRSLDELRASDAGSARRDALPAAGDASGLAGADAGSATCCAICVEATEARSDTRREALVAEPPGVCLRT